MNHAPMIGPRGPRPPRPGVGAGAPAGGGPYSGVNTYATCRVSSTATVFAPTIVGTVATTVYLSGESSCTTVMFPSRPAGMYISFWDWSQPNASTPFPFGISATTLPDAASTTTDVLLQREKLGFV